MSVSSATKNGSFDQSEFMHTWETSLSQFWKQPLVFRRHCQSEQGHNARTEQNSTKSLTRKILKFEIKRATICPSPFTKLEQFYCAPFRRHVHWKQKQTNTPEAHMSENRHTASQRTKHFQILAKRRQAAPTSTLARSPSSSRKRLEQLSDKKEPNKQPQKHNPQKPMEHRLVFYN